MYLKKNYMVADWCFKCEVCNKKNNKSVKTGYRNWQYAKPNLYL